MEKILQAVSVEEKSCERSDKLSEWKPLTQHEIKWNTPLRRSNNSYIGSIITIIVVYFIVMFSLYEIIA